MDSIRLSNKFIARRKSLDEKQGNVELFNRPKIPKCPNVGPLCFLTAG
jgi:hypothetical protein